MDVIEPTENTQQVTDRERASEQLATQQAPTFGEKLRDKLRSVFGGASITRDLSDVEESVVEKKVDEIEKDSTQNGIDFSRIQIDDVLANRDEGASIAFETFSPYLADYDLKNGILWKDKLTKADQIGVALSKLFREIFPHGQLVSLYDEYNTNMPESTDARGIPNDNGAQLTVDDTVKQTFKNGIVEVLRENGSIAQDAEEGKDYFMISESSKQEDAKNLAMQLRDRGLLEGNIEDGELKFINPNAENPLFRKITLRTKNGRWLCEALDASSFLDPVNREYTHIIVLPEHFKEQQDKVWELLRALDIAKPDTYHNIFYDENRDTEEVVNTIRNEFAKYEKPKSPSNK